MRAGALLIQMRLLSFLIGLSELDGLTIIGREMDKLLEERILR
jgi:hypothetical protein